MGGLFHIKYDKNTAICHITSCAYPLLGTKLFRLKFPRSCLKGELELIAEGYEYPVAMRQQVGEEVHHWPERRLVGRSMRQAHAAEAALRARVAKALVQIEALNQRGRGKKRFETVSALRQAVVAILQRYGVDDLVWFRLTPHVTLRPVRAYRE